MAAPRVSLWRASGRPRASSTSALGAGAGVHQSPHHVPGRPSLSPAVALACGLQLAFLEEPQVTTELEVRAEIRLLPSSVASHRGAGAQADPEPAATGAEPQLLGCTPGRTRDTVVFRMQWEPGVAAHACDPRYLGG